MKRDWKILLTVFLISFFFKGLEVCYAPDSYIKNHEREHIVSRGDRYLVMELTAYSNHFNSTGKHPGDAGYGITASGEATRHGIVAADWNVLPENSVVFIEGVGIFEVKDTGGAIKNNKLDIYMEKESDAINFGRQWRKVYILRIGG